MTIRSSAPACIALLGVLLTAAGCDSARSPPAVTPPAATVADVIYVGGDIVTIKPDDAKGAKTITVVK